MGGGGGILSPITDTLFGKPQTVATPNYSSAAEQTAAGNLKNAQLATAANRVNQFTPYGSLNYTQSTDANGNPVWSATQSLNPAFESTFNSLAANARNAAATPFSAGPAVNTQIDTSTLPSYGINPGETYSDAIMRRLQPTLQNQQESFDVKMANQGIPVGSEAYKRAYRNFSQGQNDALTSAIVGGMGVGLQANQQAYGQKANQVGLNLAGNQQAFNQNLAAYNNPLAQLNAFQGATNPGYVTPYNQVATAGPDYLGAMGLTNQSQQANANAENARTNTMISGLFDLGGSAITKFSDIRMKENIEKIGQLRDGIGIYSWEYKPEYQSIAGYGKQIGVIAQEVEKVIPYAVTTLENGYKMVNYGLI